MDIWGQTMGIYRQATWAAERVTHRRSPHVVHTRVAPETGLNRQLRPKASGLRSTFMSEGQPRANESGPLTTFAPFKHRKEVDASMPTRSRSTRAASTSSDQPASTEPVPLAEAIVSTVAELIAREHATQNLED